MLSLSNCACLAVTTRRPAIGLEVLRDYMKAARD